MLDICMLLDWRESLKGKVEEKRWRERLRLKACLKGKEAKEYNENDGAITTLLYQNWVSLRWTLPVEIVIVGKRCLMLVRNLPQAEIANHGDVA